jgi:hypothetical protein
MFARGSHRNLGDPEPLRSKDPVGAPEHQSPGPRRLCSAPRERTSEHDCGTAELGHTELGREGGRESERPIVPRKPGNRPEGPGGGKGAPGRGTVGGKDGRNTDS